MSREKFSQRPELATNPMNLQSKWANRFMVAAIIQGALAAGLTSYLLYEGVYGTPAASRIVANLGVPATRESG